MLRHILRCTITGLILVTLSSFTRAESIEDAKAIDALNKAFIEAYNTVNAKAIADLFTDDAEISDESGDVIRGKTAITKHFDEVFREEPKATIELTRNESRFLGADSVREIGRARINPANGGSPELSRFHVIYVRKNGKWLHDVIDESAETDLTPHDRLLELEWMVGDWVDESHNGVVHTSCRWSDDKNYLLREFSLSVEGKSIAKRQQRVGWDAKKEQFRSWTFDDDGGHSEGLWTRTGKAEWTIKASGTLADGRSVIATQVFTFVNKHTAKWKATARKLDGDTEPDLNEITLVKTPPKPGSGTKK